MATPCPHDAQTASLTTESSFNAGAWSVSFTLVINYSKRQHQCEWIAASGVNYLFQSQVLRMLHPLECTVHTATSVICTEIKGCTLDRPMRML